MAPTYTTISHRDINSILNKIKTKVTSKKSIIKSNIECIGFLEKTINKVVNS